MSQNSIDDSKNDAIKLKKLPFKPFPSVEVTVIRCRNVSGGYFHDMFDTPDPQVYLQCKGAIGVTEQNTTVKTNAANAEWNEVFRFILPDSLMDDKSKEAFPLKVLLYDEDSYRPDDLFGMQQVDINAVPFDKKTDITLKFKSHGEVDIAVLKTIVKQPSFRYSLALCDGEVHTRSNRKAKVFEAMKKVYKGDECPSNINEVPNVSIVGSGGGYRATIGYSGAVEALMEEGIIDLTTNMYGLSGGGWYLTSLYTFKGLQSYDALKQFHNALKSTMENDMRLRLIDIPFIYKYSKLKNAKQLSGQPTSFVDFYGYAVGSTLLGEERIQTKLTDLQADVSEGDVPFPTFTAIQVKNSTPASRYHAHIEMTPFEISLPNYGINLCPDSYGSEWYRGCVTRKCSEIPLHFLLGKTGSAFAIMFKELLDNKSSETSKTFDQTMADFRLAIDEKNGDSEQDSEDEEEPDETKTPIEKKIKSRDGSDEFLKAAEKSKAEGGGLKEALSKMSLFTDRDFLLGRAAKVLNFTRGLQDVSSYCMNPEQTRTLPAKLNTSKKVAHFVDAALLCNVPTFSALRPQRHCDVMIVCDFTDYESDDNIDYFTVLNSERLAKSDGLKFPKIDKEELLRNKDKEVHIFEDKDDLECPIVIWFTLTSSAFQKVKDYVRQKPIKGEKSDEVPEGERFNDAFIYGNPSYATFKVQYTPLEFDRLRELMKYNVKSNAKVIKDAIARATAKRKQLSKMRG